MALKRSDLPDYLSILESKLDNQVEDSKKPICFYFEIYYEEIESQNMSYDSEYLLKSILGLAENLILRHKEHIKVVLGVLINNLAKSTINKESYKLKETINEILLASNIFKENKLLISFESAAKNRAIKFLKNLERKPNCLNSKLKGDKIVDFFFHESNLNVQLASNIGDHWIAKCPIIIAQYYSDIVSEIQRKYKIDDVYLIDFSEMYDKKSVTFGSKINLRLFKDVGKSHPKGIFNVILGDTKGEVYFIENHF